MKAIVELAGQSLEWRQPVAFTMNYELRHGDDLVATLEFRNVFSSFATARGDNGCWTFRRVGFLKARATVRPCESDDELGTFRNSFWGRGGKLELPDGRRYFATTNVWMNRLEFQDDSGAALLVMKTRGLIRLASELRITPDAVRIPELPWVVPLALYVAVMMQRDSGAAAGAAAAG